MPGISPWSGAAPRSWAPRPGGLLTQYYGWPWIFWINIPFGLLALLIADRALRKLPTESHRSRIDLWGVLFLWSAPSPS